MFLLSPLSVLSLGSLSVLLYRRYELLSSNENSTLPLATSAYESTTSSSPPAVAA